MNKEEKKKLLKEFENDQEASLIYYKAHKIYMLCFIGIVYSIVVTLYDIYKHAKIYIIKRVNMHIKNGERAGS